MTIESNPDGREAEVSGGTSRWIPCGILAAACALVIGVYWYTARSGALELSSPNPADTYYNLLVQGFRSGQLSLKKEVPPGLAQLANPYDSSANARYHVLDLSYYKGRFFLYFGVTPALLLFWPFAALTGHYFLHRQAVEIFCGAGFLVSVGLLCALWRRYFAEVSVGVVAACAVALGLATGMSALLSRADVYEVPISCGHLLTMLTLASIWRALHEPERRSRWVAAASLAYGLAVGARPSLLPGAVILLVPVLQTWSERRKILVPLAAAIIPILLIGLGLMLYNAQRFDHPFEFGIRYQMSGDLLLTRRFLSPHCLWCNFRMYFLEPTRWSGRFPFVQGIMVPPLPAGFGRVESPFGVLTNVPLVWLALAMPLAWRCRTGNPAQPVVRWFVTVVVLLFGTCALTMGFFCAACARYEAEFLPALVWLAVIGILGLERALAPTAESGQTPISKSGQACGPAWRGAARLGWGLLLVYCVGVNLLAGVGHYAVTDFGVGNNLLQAGKIQESMGYFERALRIKPDYVDAENSLALAWWQQGNREEAIRHWKQALRIKPDYAEVHCNLALVLAESGEMTEALEHGREALRLKPDSAMVHNNLGLIFWRGGQSEDAVQHWRQALQLKPDYADAHYNLGGAFFRAGNYPDAIEEWERGLEGDPDSASMHYSLGVALEKVGRVSEAIGHYEQALRLKPDFAEARASLEAARQIPAGPQTRGATEPK